MIKNVFFISGFLVFLFTILFYNFSDVNRIAQIYENAEKYLLDRQETIIAPKRKKLVKKVVHLSTKSLISFVTVCLLFSVSLIIITIVIYCF